MCTKYLVGAIFILVLTGCSSKDGVPDYPPYKIYDSAQRKLRDGNYKVAIKELEALDNRYPSGPYAQQVQLDLIYAYYKSADLQLAQAHIDRFLRLNPTHPDVDYVLYMRGLSHMILNYSALQKFCGVNRYDRNQEHARAAFLDFIQLILGYPNSQYAMDSTKRLVYLKDQLAKHELSVVEYYNKRRAYVAVVNRVEQMLHYFPDTKATRQALPYMEKAYRELQLNGQADKVREIIALNPA